MHKALLGALGGANESNMIARDFGEYACPLCRQIANSAIPIVPISLLNIQDISLPDPPAFDSVERLRQMANFLSKNKLDSILSLRRRASSGSHAALALRQFQHDMSMIMKNSTGPHSSPLQNGFHGLTSLLASIVHSNFQFSNLHCPKDSSDTCHCQQLYPLVACVAASSYTTMSSNSFDQFSILFQILTGTNDEILVTTIPLLAYDPSLLLILFVLCIFPLNSSSAYVSSLIQALFNLKVVQAMLKVFRLMSKQERDSWKKSKPEWKIIGQVIELAEKANLVDDEGSEESKRQSPGISTTVWSPQAFADNVRNSCLTYLETAAALVCCLNQQPKCLLQRPDGRKIWRVSEKFDLLVKNLGLDAGVQSNSNGKDTKPWEYLWFAIDDEFSMAPKAEHADSPIPNVLRNWFLQVETCSNDRNLVAKVTGPMNELWFPPKILRVPNMFDQLFHGFRGWRCSQCHISPARMGLCLVCSQVV